MKKCCPESNGNGGMLHGVVHCQWSEESSAMEDDGSRETTATVEKRNNRSGHEEMAMMGSRWRRQPEVMTRG